MTNRPTSDRADGVRGTGADTGAELGRRLRALLREVAAQHVPHSARIRARVELAARAGRPEQSPHRSHPADRACRPQAVTAGHCR